MKRYLHFALGLGAGIAMAVLAMAAESWWSAPQSWITQVGSASFIDVDVTDAPSGQVSGFRFRYAIKNGTARQITVRDSSRSDTRLFLQRADSLVPVTDAKIVAPTLILSSGSGDLVLEVPYEIVQQLRSAKRSLRVPVDELTPLEQQAPRSNYQRAVDLIPEELTGMVLVVDRAKLVLPKGW